MAIIGKVITCAFCESTGRDPFGIMSPLSNCQVCWGKGSIKVSPPAVICAFCRGTGEAPPQSHLTCPACQGKGVMSVKEPIEGCNACRGLGLHEVPLFSHQIVGVDALREIAETIYGTKKDNNDSSQYVRASLAGSRSGY